MNKYYFVTIEESSSWQPSIKWSILLDIHPVRFLQNEKAQYSKKEFVILFWSEVPKEVYEEVII